MRLTDALQHKVLNPSSGEVMQPINENTTSAEEVFASIRSEKFVAETNKQFAMEQNFS